MTLRQRFALLIELGPMTALLTFVFGALFAGWITATECAAWGVLGALLIALHSRTLNWVSFRESVNATLRTSCMIAILIAAAGFMSSFMAIAGNQYRDHATGAQRSVHAFAETHPVQRTRVERN